MKALLVAAAAIALGCGFGYGLSYYRNGESSGFDVLEPMAVVEVDPWLQPAAGEQQPRLVIDTEVVDLGVLSLDQTVSHQFKISNEGNAALHLRADRLSYTEYDHKLEKNDLAPGESTTLSISWTPQADTIEGRWTSMDPPGDFSRMISLSSNDPKSPRKLLGVHGIHVPPAVIEKDSFELGMCDPTVEHVVKTRVYAYHTDEFTITSADLANPALKDFFDVAVSRLSTETLAELPEFVGVEAKAGFDITITIKPGMPMGEFRQLVRLPVRPFSKMNLSVSISGETPTDFRIDGKHWNRTLAAVNLGGVLAPEGATAEISAYFTGELRDQINLQFESAEPDLLQVELRDPSQAADGKTTIYGIKIIVPPNSPPVEYAGPLAGGEFGKLRFRTDHPRLPFIDVPIVITILQ